jgi:hypothetical protein
MADLQDDLQDLHTFFETCGIVEDPATRNLLLNLEGFTRLDNVGDLEDDNDVTAMAGRMSRRTQAEGRIILGTKVIKRLQTLTWWICDQKNNNNVTAMAGRMSHRTQAKGRIILGTKVIKRLQTLTWWIRDQKKQNLHVVAADFNDDCCEECTNTRMVIDGRSLHIRADVTVGRCLLYYWRSFNLPTLRLVKWLTSVNECCKECTNTRRQQ